MSFAETLTKLKLKLYRDVIYGRTITKLKLKLYCYIIIDKPEAKTISWRHYRQTQS